MSSNAQSLPTEIWLTIFSMIKIQEGGNLATCRLVCKTWRPLVENVFYKQIDMNGWTYKRYALFSEHLSTRPDLGQLIQEIKVGGCSQFWNYLYQILKKTPNVKTLKGRWTGDVLDKVFADEVLWSLKLEELPWIEGRSQLLPRLQQYYKDTLESVYFSVLEDTNLEVLSRLRFKKLSKVAINDVRGFQNIKQLESVIKGFTQVKELEFQIAQISTYTHTDQGTLRQWLQNDVTKLERIKTLIIRFESDGLLHRPQNLPRALGPDWMEYLAYKCPNVKNLKIAASPINIQHIPLPIFRHIETSAFLYIKFYDLTTLKHFVDVAVSENVHLEWKTFEWGRTRSNETVVSQPYLCLINANSSRNTKLTTIEIIINPSQHSDTTNQAIADLFSAKNNKHWSVRAPKKFTSETWNQTCDCNVKSLRVVAEKMCIRDGDQLQTAAALRNLALANVKRVTKWITQMSRSAPNLNHLTISNCSFTNINLVPSSRLSSITIHARDASSINQKFEPDMLLLFYVHTALHSKTHIFFAAPGEGLQMITEREYETSANPTIHIKCGALQTLNVDIEDIKFTMEFDSDNGLIKSASAEIAESVNHALFREHTLLKSQYANLEQKYARSLENAPTRTTCIIS